MTFPDLWWEVRSCGCSHPACMDPFCWSRDSVHDEQENALDEAARRSEKNGRTYLVVECVGTLTDELDAT